MNRKVTDYAMITAGVLLLAGGFCMLVLFTGASGFLQVLPYLLIGIGCGILSQGVGNILGRRMLKKNPEIIRQIEIETKDERNLAISYKAKAKAYDLQKYIFGALLIVFAAMRFPLAAVLLLLGAYLFVMAYAVYCRFKIEKEM